MQYNQLNNNNIWFVTRWEANGYNDSDGDVIFYNSESKKIVHYFWTTRGYCPCSAPDAPSYKEGVDANIITECEVLEALRQDTFKENFVISLYSIMQYADEISNLGLPVVVNKGRGYRGKGILTRVLDTPYIDYFGRTCTKSEAIIFNPKTNTLHKTGLHNVEIDTDYDTSSLKQCFFNSLTIADICSYISFSNSCSPHYNYWVQNKIASKICPIISVDISNATMVEQTRRPNKSTYEKAKAKVAEKTVKYRAWVDSLDETPEKREEIFNLTMNKYCLKEMQIIEKYEKK